MFESSQTAKANDPTVPRTVITLDDSNLHIRHSSNEDFKDALTKAQTSIDQQVDDLKKSIMGSEDINNTLNSSRAIEVENGGTEDQQNA